MVDSIDNIISDGVSELFETLEKNQEEMALIAINGGYELTIRDRLIYVFQKRLDNSEDEDLNNYIVRSEYCVKGKGRADLAILKPSEEEGDENLEVIAFIELKHNYSFQLKQITGYLLSEWRKNRENITVRDRDTRLLEDYKKWYAPDMDELNGNMIYGINIVTCFDDIGDNNRVLNCLKYKSVKNIKKNEECMGHYLDYLDEFDVDKDSVKPRKLPVAEDFGFFSDIEYKFSCEKNNYNISGLIHVAMHKGRL